MRALRVRVVAAVVAAVSVTGVATVVHADDGDDPPPAAGTTAPMVMTVTVQTEPAAEQPEAPAAPSADAGAATTVAPASDHASVVAVTEQPTTTVDAPPTTESGSTPTTVAAADDSASTESSDSTLPIDTTTTLNPVQQHVDQQTIATGTQVAVAVSGGNRLDDRRPTQPPGSVPAANVATGAVTAIGSRDSNTVDQQADLDLTDQAVANLLQIALILNVGAALANSGVNGVTATAGGSGAAGAIASGNASAVGNDSDQYLTQAARATGDADTDSGVDQLALSVNMGLASAGSGLNAVTGTGVAGTGGSIGSGSASAIGNDAETGVLQQASITGSGTSVIDVVQRATVLNLGFALANSGLNDVTGVAGQLLASGNDQSDAVARDLFSMLLPAMLSSYAGDGGQGAITTGDATAIGNRSSTFIAQIADAAASGDGVAQIVQDVLIANVGAAGANTGGNALGGAYASIDPKLASATITLAAFLASMLALVNTNTSQALAVAQDAGLDVPFGDLVLEVRGQLQGLDTTAGTGGGTRANVRQVTIIISLGVARANSGLNATVSVADGTPAAAVVSRAIESTASVTKTVDAISTGDVSATNRRVTVICQRVRADDVACLAPPTTPVPAAPTTTAPPSVGPAEGQLVVAPPDASGGDDDDHHHEAGGPGRPAGSGTVGGAADGVPAGDGLRLQRHPAGRVGDDRPRRPLSDPATPSPRRLIVSVRIVVAGATTIRTKTLSRLVRSCGR